MSKIKWTSLVLLLIIILDASGDAFRLNGWQLAHHIMESIQIAGWIAIWAVFRFNPVFIVMYILGRFIGFDLVYNLIAGNIWWYVGDNSLYGKFFIWFADLVGQPIGLMISIPKIMALAWWTAWFSTDRTFRNFKFCETL